MVTTGLIFTIPMVIDKVEKLARFEIATYITFDKAEKPSDSFENIVGRQ
jgi:hypothetical protein